MTKVLRTVGKYSLNKGYGMSVGLYNVSTADNEISIWFDEETANDLLNATNLLFIEKCKNLI